MKDTTKKNVKILLVIALVIAIPSIILAVVYAQPGVPGFTVEGQTEYIESHLTIEEQVTSPSGVTYWKFIEGPFYPFYTAGTEDGLLRGPTKAVYITKTPGDFNSGSSQLIVQQIDATEAEITAMFKITSLYLLNGSAKVFYSKDAFDSRGTYTVLFNVNGVWYFNQRGSDICMEKVPSFVTLDEFLANIVIQVNAGQFLDPFPR